MRLINIFEVTAGLFADRRTTIATFVAGAAALAACGSSFDRDGAIQTVQDAFGLDAGQAACVVDGIVEEFGEEMVASDDEVTAEQVEAIIGFVDSCSDGQVSTGATGGAGEVVDVGTRDPMPPISDPTLAALGDDCAAGSGEACDDLYWQSDLDSAEEDWAARCGGTAELTTPCPDVVVGTGSIESVEEVTTGVARDCSSDSTIVAWGGGEVTTDGDELAVTSTFAVGRYIAPNAGGLSDEESRPAREAAVANGFEGYSIWIADHPLDTELLSSRFAFPDDVEPGLRRASIHMVPPTTDPIATGDVIEVGRPAWESNTTFPGTLFAMVETAERTSGHNWIADSEGSVTVVSVDDETICLDVDYVAYDNLDAEVIRLTGRVAAPVVHGDGPEEVYL